MKCFVFKPKRRPGGKVAVSTCYSGRYRLSGEFRDTTIALGVSDKQVAEAKLRRIVQELEREGEGLIPSRKLRDGLQMPFSGLVAERVSEPCSTASLTARLFSVEMVETRSTASAKNRVYQA